jgi:HSP20 family protein
MQVNDGAGLTRNGLRVHHPEDHDMTEVATKPRPNESKRSTTLSPWHGWEILEPLHREIERLFETFPTGPWPSFFRERGKVTVSMPAIDIVEKDNAYEITAELPAIDEKNVDVKYAEGMLTIRGEKEESKEEKKKDYHLSERRYGSFRRSFSVPAGTDPDRIAATFSKGVLTVTLPKSSEARSKEKKIPVTAR